MQVLNYKRLNLIDIKRKSLSYLFATIYAVTLIYIVFFSRRRRGMHTLFNYRSANLIPFKNKILYLSAHDYVLRGNIGYSFYSDLFGNILLFAPLPFFLSQLAGINSFRKTVAVSAVTSFTIEIIQFISGIGIADIDDLILNTTGACLGFLLLKLFRPDKFSINHS